MHRLPNRRDWLQITGATIAGAYAYRPQRVQAAPAIDVVQTQVISRRPDLYHGWPTIARRRSGELLVACSGGREAHVCPFGRVEVIRSRDDGRTWSDPEVVADTLLDDRDAGVLETARGTVLVTTFTSLAYEPILVKAEKIAPGTPGAWDPARLARWQKARDTLSAEQRKQRLGCWIMRMSEPPTSGGNAAWSAPLDSLVNSPHGPCQLADGRLLYAGKELWKAPGRIGVCQSADDGRSWQWLAEIPTRAGDDVKNYHELHGVECAAGRLVVQIRNHNRANAGETLQTESTDGGKSWSTPHEIGVWGLPSHLLRLRDGRLVMTYGHRRPPFGNQARVSADDGRSWSEPVIISGDGAGGDLGYPSTVELADGTLLSVWYELMKGSPRAVLRQAHWVLKSA